MDEPDEVKRMVGGKERLQFCTYKCKLRSVAHSREVAETIEKTPCVLLAHRAAHKRASFFPQVLLPEQWISY